jgi:hypothetical protein
MVSLPAWCGLHAALMGDDAMHANAAWTTQLPALLKSASAKFSACGKNKRQIDDSLLESSESE